MIINYRSGSLRVSLSSKKRERIVCMCVCTSANSSGFDFSSHYFLWWGLVKGEYWSWGTFENHRNFKFFVGRFMECFWIGEYCEFVRFIVTNNGSSQSVSDFRH
ncbi:hypothetical protein P8452_46026 [Trifolium repens]|nr:hypothetical protein P8452_46026 [Trifolium repens]